MSLYFYTEKTGSYISVEDTDAMLWELQRPRREATQKERTTWWPQTEWEGQLQGFGPQYNE